MDSRGEHVEAVSGDRDDIAIAGCELGAKCCPRRPSATAGRIAEIGVRPRALKIIVNLTHADRVVEHEPVILERLSDLVREPAYVNRRVARRSLCVVGERLAASFGRLAPALGTSGKAFAVGC